MNCTTCGKQVVKHPQRKGKNVFCSTQCFSQNKEIGKIEYKKCLTCKNEFRAFIKQNSKFCSRLCFFAYASRNKITKECQFCGSSFQTSEHKLNKGLGVYCSNSCTRKSVRLPDNARYSINKYGCWIWTCHIDKRGYGKTSIGTRSISAHQYFYEKKNGKTPEGLELDHICRNTACCNPDHLKLVTHHENVLRGNRSGINSQKIEAIHDILSLEGFRNCLEKVAESFGVSTSFVKNL